MTGNTEAEITQAGNTPVAITPSDTVRSFLDAWALDDHLSALALVDPDIEYANVGYSFMRGKKRLAGMLSSMAKTHMGFGVKWVNITSDGQVVMTERIDELSLGRFRAQFWVCGRFEVEGGLITVWRDYFDMVDVLKGSLRGLVAIAFPRIQKPLPKPSAK
ncbi:limonene-1,2-epoxide hydrolase family protein [Nocardia sp. 348MFTsu5.1]|uniref:limonene-1,2-epoxide hydrolase family protein n=1 Tax=Nocardia sp. 348MFTsu5.1 TaxID=1172185 RepID=UPI00035F420D|nr:limonene-1,2-epoxide hydrolase family protein [Nocardia sp. 348MFTsu5.1]